MQELRPPNPGRTLGAIAGLLLALLPAAHASLDSLSRHIGSASLPRNTVLHDVDLDGDLDVVYADSGESNNGEIGWFENAAGDGSQWTRHTLAGGLQGACVVRVADLDGDGRPDLLIGLRSGASILWMKRQAGANFSAPSLIRASVFSLENVETADLNGDGLTDILYSSTEGPRWLRQQPGFTFAAPAVIANVSASNIQPILVGDFDKDGDIDVVTALTGFTNRIIFSRNNGNGTFSAPVTLADAMFPRGLASADLDGDGFADLISASEDFVDSRVFWLKNNGNGTFGPRRDLNAPGEPSSAVVAVDMDRDGDPDIVATGTYNNVLLWFENLGGGSFAPGKSIRPGLGSMSYLTAGDLDQDGDPDLVVSLWENRSFFWHRNLSPPPTIEPPRILSFTTLDTSVGSDPTLHWETDGADEVEISHGIGAVAPAGSQNVPLSATRTFTLTARNAGGASTAELTVVVGERPLIRSFTAPDTSVALNTLADLAWDVAGADQLTLDPAPGNVTGNGHQPLIAQTTTFTLRASNEFGESSAELIITAGSPPIIQSLLAAPTSIPVNSTSTLVWQATGADTVFVSGIGEVPVGDSVAVQPASTRTYTVTATNAFGSVSRSVSVNVTGNLLASSSVNLTPFAHQTYRVKLADLDGDNAEDLIVGTYSSSRGTITWYRQTAPGVFGDPTPLVTQSGFPYISEPYDIDRNGDLDLAIGFGESAVWLPNPGSGGVPDPPRPFHGSATYPSDFLADFDGDGFTDFAGRVGNALYVAFGTESGDLGPLHPLDSFGNAIEAIVSTVGDIDGDGDPDVVAGKDFEGDVFWYENVDGAFVRRSLVLSGAGRLKRIIAADVDGDGDNDLLIQTGDARLELLLNPGSGNFAGVTPRVISTGVSTLHDFEIGDLDLDGDPDLVAIGSTAIALLENRSGSFAVRQTISVSPFQQLEDVALGDVDGDGDLDVVIADSGNNTILLYRNQYARKAPPVAIDPVVPLLLQEDFGEYRLPLSPLVGDADTPADQIVYSIRSMTGDDIFTTADIDPVTRELRFVSADDLHGSASLIVRATDPQGLMTHLRIEPVVEPMPDAPRVVAAPPPLTAAADGAPLVFDAAPFFSDPDEGDRLAYTVTDNTNPVITSRVTLDATTGRLDLEFAPYVSGATVLEITATDLTGLQARLELHVILPEPAPPSVALNGDLVLNRQTGLYEKRLTISNTGARDLGGFRLQLDELPDGVTLHNASAGDGIIDYLIPVPVGGQVELILEFHSSSRVSGFDPEIHLVPGLPAAPAAGDGMGFAIDRCELLDDGGLLIEFTSRPGATYEIQYSDDSLLNWKSSPVPIQAAGNRVQWIDRGPPRTDAPPATKKSRFYRVTEIADP